MTVAIDPSSLPPWLLLMGVAVSSCHGSVRHESLDAGPTHQCIVDEDCPLGQICSVGNCVAGCRPEADRCPPGEVCIGGNCHPVPDASKPDSGADAARPDGGPPVCPSDMAPVGALCCMDRYEASRPDATDTWQGEQTTMATSRRNVLPWMPVEKATAQAACAAAGKRLCTPDEFRLACRGPADTDYVYGDDYDPVTCNGIDTYCYCGSGSPCDGISPCPYAHCYGSPPEGHTEPAEGCSAAFQLMPTASFPACVDAYGHYDLCGNVWELVDDGTAKGQFRAGAYNCINSELLHLCDFSAGDVLAKGFRCCL